MTYLKLTVLTFIMADGGTMYVTRLISMVDTCQDQVCMVKELTGPLGMDISTL
jgi:hypothetical protein